MSSLYSFSFFVDDTEGKMPVVLKYKGTGKDVAIAASFLNGWKDKVVYRLVIESV